MNIKNLILLTTISILLVGTCGCNDLKSNNESNNENYELDISLISIPLTLIALNESEVENLEKIREDYYDEPYTSNNLTGNNITWDIQEGYFATFAGNTSRLLESIIKFESKEKAIHNLDLYKPYLLMNDFNEESIKNIGNKSFLLRGNYTLHGNKTDIFLLTFSISNVVVSLQSFGSDQLHIIHYAEIIENRIIDTF
jgi:hypothetical protein